MSKTLRRLPSPAVVISCIALFVALSGVGYAAFTLPDNSVKSRHIVNGQVKAADIAGNAVSGAKVLDDSLSGSDVNESLLGQVPSAAVADNALDANHADAADNADLLDGKDSTAFGASYSTASQFPDVNTCDEQVVTLCTWVTTTVPAGKNYRFTLVATGSAFSTATDRLSLRFGYRQTGTTAPTEFGIWNAVALPANTQTSFSNASTIVLGPGTWDVGVVTLTDGELEIAPGDTGRVQLLATITDANVAAPASVSRNATR